MVSPALVTILIASANRMVVASGPVELRPIIDHEVEPAVGDGAAGSGDSADLAGSSDRVVGRSGVPGAEDWACAKDSSLACQTKQRSFEPAAARGMRMSVNRAVGMSGHQGFGPAVRGRQIPPGRDLSSVRCIAAIISRLEVVALQEARGRSRHTAGGRRHEPRWRVEELQAIAGRLSDWARDLNTWFRSAVTTRPGPMRVRGLGVATARHRFGATSGLKCAICQPGRSAT